MFSNTKTKLDKAAIDRLLANAFGHGAQSVQVTELTEGMFNAIYDIRLMEPLFGTDEIILKAGVQNGKHILAYEKEIMRTELYIYGLLPSIGVPAPKVRFADTSKTLVDCDYFFMEKLAGDTWAHLMPQISPGNMAELQRELGEYTAKLHSVGGPYFGYIKEDVSYHYPTWREAFRAFIDRMTEDGIRDGVELPYGDIYKGLEPYWHLLDEVRTPSVVNYDMWAKNIMLICENGRYRIDGIIDHERAFYGDPIAEFLSTQTICGNLENAAYFRKGYESVRPFVFGESEKIRMKMYQVYMALMVGVEIYRYDVDDREAFMQRSGQWIQKCLAELNC